MKSPDTAALILSALGFATIIILLVLHSSLPYWLFLILDGLAVGCFASAAIVKLRTAVSFRRSDHEQ